MGIKYVTDDGSLFDTLEAAKAHEASSLESRLAGLTPDQVRAALAREDLDLAEAFEQAGNRIAKLRRDSGDLKRRGPRSNGTGSDTPPLKDAAHGALQAPGDASDADDIDEAA